MPGIEEGVKGEKNEQYVVLFGETLNSKPCLDDRGLDAM